VRIARIFIAVIFSALCGFAGGNVNDLGPKIPKQVLDWQASGEDAVYDRKTLYDYMDGGAEVYLAYDFREVFVRKYADAEENELNLDIYDMGSPAEAFGIFSTDREDPPAGIGQGSEYGPGLLRFWRGRYFVSITVSGDEDKAEAAVLELGRKVAPLLGPDGTPPDLLNVLPAEGLIKEKTSYFHDSVHLNNRYFVSPENVLGLDAKTECVFAEYDLKDGGSGKVLFVRYTDAAKAAAAAASFRKALLPGADAEGAGLDKNGKWMMMNAREKSLVVIFEAPFKEYAGRLAAAVMR